MYLFFIVTLPVMLAETTNSSEEKKINIDKKHIETDFLNIFGMLVNIFSDKEMDLQYFATHDFDENKKLDGLELFNALYHEFSHKAENSEIKHSEKDTENEMDAIFSEYDVNNDGFLDYTEFKKAHKIYEKFNTESNGT